MGQGQDSMMGITNKAGQIGCNHCFDPRHWLNMCPHKDVSGAELKILRKKNRPSPQLLHVGKEDGGELDDNPSLGDLNGYPAPGPYMGQIGRLILL